MIARCEIDVFVVVTPDYFLMLAIAPMLRPLPPLAVEDRTLLAVSGLVGCVGVLPLVSGAGVFLMSGLIGTVQSMGMTGFDEGRQTVSILTQSQIQSL